MGSGQSVGSKQPILTLQFADVCREQALGDRIDWLSEYCELPDSSAIPKMKNRTTTIRTTGRGEFQLPDISSMVSSMVNHVQLNEDFYCEPAEYVFIHRLIRKVRFVVSNTGELPATDVRLEIYAPNGECFGFVEESEIPNVPKQREDFFDNMSVRRMKIRPSITRAGYVCIDKNDHETKVDIECGNLQPGRKL